MRTSLCVVFMALAATALAPRAASAEEDIEQAKALFNAGAQAYAATRYRDAVQSFEAAYRKAPRPALLFSLAQAYRRLYVVEQSPEALRAAIANYRRYLEEVPRGGRRADATEALSELGVITARLEASAPSSPAAPAAPEAALPDARPRTRINVTSPTAGARVSIDGRAPVEVPLMAEVQPGKHRIKITADGHIDEEREVVAIEGDVLGIDRELRERPALLQVKAPDGAQVTLDGRFVGTTPLPLIQVAPGKRFFVATKNGHKPFSRELSLRRGERRVIEVDLSSSFQRKMSYGLVAVGVLSAAVGVLTLSASLAEEEKAREIEEKRGQQGISEEELGQYRAHLDTRDELANATTGLFGTATAFALGGFVFYAFDAPTPPPLPARTDPTPARTGGPMLELSAAPILGPGLGGAGLVGRFW
ncbi:PEGA domain-containing protein [Sorangium sp. So ce388]|uniref:PEGA domain-containing protein n=1 Tax=Sorangium sp. So ce388 TaxID=3133309 RepID=UPI003F5BC973